jgi:cobalamin biosynthesis protein CobD/CbiB
VRLGGGGHYAGVPSHRPAIGAENAAPSGSDLGAAVRLLLAAEMLILAFAAIAALIAFAYA